MLLDDPVVRCVLFGYIEPTGLHPWGDTFMYQLTPNGQAVLARSGGADDACLGIMRRVDEGR